jgi:malate/lactate dehydrogenase
VALGRKGVVRTVGVPLDSDEQGHLARSAKRLRDVIERVEGTQEAGSREAVV